MIKNIKIENFKSIQSLDLDLGRLNVFIGANGSGKSNILEGICLGSAALENKSDNIILVNRGIRLTEPRFMMPIFKLDKGKSQILLTIKSENETFQIIIEHKNSPTARWGLVNFDKDGVLSLIEYLENNHSDLIPDTLKKLNGYIKSNTEFATEFVNGLLDKLKTQKSINGGGFANFFIYAPENTYLRKFEDDGAAEPLGVKGEGLFKHLVEIFREYPEKASEIKENLQLIDWFEDFEIPKDLMFTEKRIAIKDRFLEEGLGDFDQRSANEGFLYLLFYFTLFISDKTPKFFAIDNIDNALNPKLGSELIHILTKLAKKHNKQVILTTHNPAILDGLDLEDDEQRLFVISRNKAGHTQAVRIPYKESEERLSTKFIRGSIGGVPKNF